ncbi:MAG: hypothetical protein FWE14_09360 [Lachnospiraceae bacterium]|nr:hypothetical protein [Lachnospiraceae bacterium]
MKKTILKFFMVAFLLIGLIVPVACHNDSFSSIPLFSNSNQSEVIIGLNQTYEGHGLKITAIGIRAIPTLEIGRYQTDYEIVIGINLLVENTSNKMVHFGTDISVYINDFEAPHAYFGYFDEGGLIGSIMPGRKAAGYYPVYALKNTNQIELVIEVSYSPARYVTFILDVPPIEENDESSIIY